MSLFVISVTILTACIPLVAKLLHKPSPHSWLPVLAGLLSFAAFFIPDIHISKETTTFQQHFIGGGVYCAMLYVYFRGVIGWQANFTLNLLLLFAWVSAFGVANELLEFTLTKFHVTQIDIGDTDWDLLANTSGAVVGYLVLTVLKPTVIYFHKLRDAAS